MQFYVVAEITVLIRGDNDHRR